MAVCVDFPEIVADGGALDPALKALEGPARARLQRCSPTVKAVLSSPRNPGLEVLPVSVVMENNASDPLALQVGARYRSFGQIPE